jgi:tetratricopeptide (TPR) repeat protein
MDTLLVCFVHTSGRMSQCSRMLKTWLLTFAGAAIVCLNKASNLFTDNDSIYYLMGKVYQGDRKWRAALDNFRKVKYSSPDYGDALGQIGTICYDHLYEYDNAYKAYKEAVDPYPRNKIT